MLGQPRTVCTEAHMYVPRAADPARGYELVGLDLAAFVDDFSVRLAASATPAARRRRVAFDHRVSPARSKGSSG